MLYKINFNGVQSPKLINPATFTDRPHVSKSVYGLQEISRSPSRTLAASTSTISVENAPKIKNVEYKDGTFTVTGTINCQLPAEVIYQSLTDYERLSEVFRNVESCTVQRNHDDGSIRLLQMVMWKFLIFRGSFVTELEVVEDAGAYELSFKLLRSAFMRKFVGTWKVAEDEKNIGNCTIQHTISVNPTVKPPQRIGDITKHIFETQVRGILDDLSNELAIKCDQTNSL